MEEKLQELYEHLGFEHTHDPDGTNKVLVVNQETSLCFIDDDQGEIDHFVMLAVLAPFAENAGAMKYLLTENAQLNRGITFGYDEDSGIFCAQVAVDEAASTEAFIGLFEFFVTRVEEVSKGLKERLEFTEAAPMDHMQFAL